MPGAKIICIRKTAPLERDRMEVIAVVVLLARCLGMAAFMHRGHNQPTKCDNVNRGLDR
jgi:hypothetical protein